MTLQPGNRLGSYEILEKIGAGGMGAVYKAYQPALGRYVAIKVLPPQTSGDPTFAERFAQEARAIGKLRHPNIVTAFDFAHDGDVAFLVSEFIDGGTLAEQLGTPLPVDYALQVITPIASALDYAHARGIVHRDIKPQNVLLTRDGMPVLTDFGLAKIVGPGSGMTQAGSLMGTAEYMAPECASGAEVAGPAADQYALALIAYQMLVGQHPFPADNPLSALMAHVHKPVPIPSTLGITLPPGVEAALLRGLAKRPGERFPRCSDFVRALSGSAFAGMGPLPATAGGVVPSTSPSEPPTIPPAAMTSQPSPLLSPSALVRPVAAELPPAPAPAPTVVAAIGAAAAAAPRPLTKAPPWWRRKRMLILPAILVALAIFSLPRPEGRIAGLTSPASDTPRPTRRETTPAATATPALTATPVATTAAPVIASATPVRTAVPTPIATPLPTPTPAATAPTGSSPQTAVPMTPGALYSGTIDPATEVDWFKFSASANVVIAVEFKGSTLAGGAVALLIPSAASSGVTVLKEETDTGTGVTFRYTTTDAGVYFLRIRSTRGTTGAYSTGVGLLPR